MTGYMRFGIEVWVSHQAHEFADREIIR